MSQKVKVKNGELISLNGAMAAVIRGNEKISVKLSYAIHRNQQVVKPVIAALQEANKPIPEYKEFEKDRIELCKKMAKKDEKGNPVITKVAPMLPNQPPQEDYVIEDPVAFEKAMEDLRLKHKKALDEVDARQKEYNDILSAESEVEFFYVSTEFFPKELSGPLNALMVFAIPPGGECPNCGNRLMEVIEGGGKEN